MGSRKLILARPINQLGSPHDGTYLAKAAFSIFCGSSLSATYERLWQQIILCSVALGMAPDNGRHFCIHGRHNKVWTSGTVECVQFQDHRSYPFLVLPTITIRSTFTSSSFYSDFASSTSLFHDEA